MVQVQKITLKHYIGYGEPKASDFEIKTVDLDEGKLGDKQILVKAIYISVDPYIRGRMSQGKSYIEPFKVGESINCGGVGKVIKSNNSKFQADDYVLYNSFPFEQQFFFNGDTEGLVKIDKNLKVPLGSYLSALGMTGMTAYFGLLDIGEPKQGETVVVSAGSGAVGQMVGQIAKLKGCKVVGIAGSSDKCDFMTKQLGFDIAVNYKSPTYKDDIKNACDKGVDVYFENVGGEVSDPIFNLLNTHARIPVCGAISAYNATSDIGPRQQLPLLKARAKMQAFIVFDFAKKFPEAVKQIAGWMIDGKIKDQLTINKGFDQIIPSFLSLFNSTHFGKVVIKVADE